MKTTIFAALAALAITAASPAAARDVEGWEVVDHGTSCIMYSNFKNGTVLSLYSDGDDDLMFTLQNKRWAALEDDASYEINVEFDDWGKWDRTGFASRNIDEDGPGFSFFVPLKEDSRGYEFLAEFTMSSGMKVTKDGTTIVKLDLSGSRAAFQAMTSCIAPKRGRRDPFKSIDPDSKPEPTRSSTPTV
jgi:hypothetical protein